MTKLISLKIYVYLQPGELIQDKNLSIQNH